MNDRKTKSEIMKQCFDAFRVLPINSNKNMPKICPITKKSSLLSGGYSNATRATQFNPTGKVRKQVNFQKKRIYVPELKKTFVLNLSTKGIKTIQKNGAYVTLKKAGIIK